MRVLDTRLAWERNSSKIAAVHADPVNGRGNCSPAHGAKIISFCDSGPESTVPDRFAGLPGMNRGERTRKQSHRFGERGLLTKDKCRMIRAADLNPLTKKEK